MARNLMKNEGISQRTQTKSNEQVQAEAKMDSLAPTCYIEQLQISIFYNVFPGD